MAGVGVGVKAITVTSEDREMNAGSQLPFSLFLSLGPQPRGMCTHTQGPSSPSAQLPWKHPDREVLLIPNPIQVTMEMTYLPCQMIL